MDRDTALRILGLGELRAPEDEAIDGAYWRLRAHLERRAEQAESARARDQRRAELTELELALRSVSGAAPEPEQDAPAARPLRAAPWLIVWAGLATLIAGALSLLLWGALSRQPEGDLASAPGGVAAGAGGAPAQTPAAGPLASEDAGPQAALDDGPLAAADATAAQENAVSAGRPLAHGASPEGNAGPGSAAASGPLEPAVLIARANLANSRLSITRSGDGVSVFRGASDDSEHTLAPGRYVLRVSNPDCSDLWESEVALEPGERRKVEARNCEEKGWLVIRSNVVGDRVAIDARPVGGSGPTRHAVSVGEHRILVQKEGYVTWEGVTRVKPAQLVTLRAQLFEAAQTGPASPADSEGSDGDLAQRQRRLEDAWHKATKRWLLGRYDRDLSGRIDTPSEVRAIDCRDLSDIEGTFDRADLGVPMTRFFGFDGSAWVDGALGFDRSVREVAYARMQECGLR